MLVNVNEEIIKVRMESILKGYDCCKCEKCVNDMMALALNSTKPAYVNTDEGVLFKRINSTLRQTTTDIDIAIVKAVEMVSSNPKHPAPTAEEKSDAAETSAPPEEKPAAPKKSDSTKKKTSSKKKPVSENNEETDKPAPKRSSGKKAAAGKPAEAEVKPETESGTQTDIPGSAPETQMELF